MSRATRTRVVFVMPRCRHDHVRAVHKQAWSLREAGHEVVLVTSDSGVSDYLGMPVVAARGSAKSLLRPLLNLPALLRQSLELDGDIYVLRNPDTIPLALLLLIARRKVVYDTHEDFSLRPLIHEGVPRWLRRISAWLITGGEKLLARFGSAMFVTQRQQADTFGGKAQWLPNAPLISGPIVDAAKSHPAARDDDSLSFLYVGVVNRRRGAILMLDMMVRMNRDMPCRLDLVGWFHSDALFREMQAHDGWRYVRFHGEVSHPESLAFMPAADVGLAILDAVADHPTSSITKLYEYMQFGLPFIASNFPAWRVSTPEGMPGYYVDPESLDEVLAAAQSLANDPALREQMGEIGRRYVTGRFNWERLGKPFVATIEKLAGPEM